MASDESVSMLDLVDDDDDCDIDDVYHHHHRVQPHPYPHNLSRLSMCTSNSTVYGDHDNLSRLSMCTSNSTVYGDHDDDDGGGDANYFLVDEGDNSDDGGGHSIRTFMSRLSIESFNGDGDADADEEFSDEKEGKEICGGLSSDSDQEPLMCYSLPATPPRRRNRSGGLNQQQQFKRLLLKEYASENEVQKDFLLHRQKMRKKTIMRRRRRRIVRERWLERATATGDHSGYNNLSNMEEVDDMGGSRSSGGGGGNNNNYNYNYNSNWGNSKSYSYSGGESEEVGGGGGGGLVVITRAKGGRRSLCMDLEEVKACRDLGFELEHERTLEIMPTRLSISVSGSPLDTNTSSGGNSPISNWRISSPGDDPRDVKARLKVWAQAVALASTSRHGC